ncbi:MAG: acyl-[acyl-carrier-protein] thioesterase [Sphaerochaetaceae bacterium]|jgi:medium-chain acyl-[acyl-carrier-protein] hydrolase
MQIIDGIYHEEFTLQSSDVDSLNAAHPSYYFNVVQEVAGNHAHHIGVSIPQLHALDKTWVVTRTKMTIFSYAQWPHRIKVTTWPQVPWKFYFPRACTAHTEEGEPLFESMSQWVVVDIHTQRPVKPDQVIPLFGDHMKEEILNPNLGRKLSLPEEQKEMYFEYHTKPLYHHTDFNNHVNNVVYVSWMLDSLPFTFRDSYLPYEIDISYVAQSFRDDTIVVQSTQVNDDHDIKFIHEVIRSSDNQSLAVAHTLWKKRP